MKLKIVCWSLGKIGKCKFTGSSSKLLGQYLMLTVMVLDDSLSGVLFILDCLNQEYLRRSLRFSNRAIALMASKFTWLLEYARGDGVYGLYLKKTFIWFW